MSVLRIVSGLIESTMPSSTTCPLGFLMRADSLDELKRLLGDLRVEEIEPAFVSVFEVVEVTPDRELDVAACDISPLRIASQ